MSFLCFFLWINVHLCLGWWCRMFRRLKPSLCDVEAFKGRFIYPIIDFKIWAVPGSFQEKPMELVADRRFLQQRYYKQFKFFLCHQKAGAGSMARLLKMELERLSRSKTCWWEVQYFVPSCFKWFLEYLGGGELCLLNCFIILQTRIWIIWLRRKIAIPVTPRKHFGGCLAVMGLNLGSQSSVFFNAVDGICNLSHSAAHLPRLQTNWWSWPIEVVVLLGVSVFLCFSIPFESIFSKSFSLDQDAQHRSHQLLQVPRPSSTVTTWMTWPGCSAMSARIP